MKRAWTEAPWSHYDDSQEATRRHEIVAMGKTIAHIYCTKGDEADDAANGCLIAAAPELYEALHALVVTLAARPDFQPLLGFQERTEIEAARVALKKAGG